MFSLSGIHLNDVCRACMSSKSDMESLTAKHLAEMYTTCTSLNYSDDDLLPKRLCTACIKLLESLNKFRVMCHSSEAALISYVSCAKVELPDSNFHDSSSAEKCMILNTNIKRESEDPFSDFENDSAPLSPIIQIQSHTLKQRVKLKKKKKRKPSPKLQIIEKSTHRDNSECTLCKKTFAYTKSFEKHKLLCGKNGIIKLRNFQKDILPKPTVLLCGLCSVEYKTYENLNAHLEKHRQDEDSSCSICDYKSIDWADLLCHRYSHQPSGYNIQIKCWGCTKRFINVERLEFHVRSVHLGKRPGLCKICHKEFMNINNWRAHKFIHSGIKASKCQICGKSFTCNRSLVLHLRCHSDVKKYVCDTCGIKFRFRTGLTSHLQRRHSEVQPLICNHCGKNFKNKETLREHLLRTTSVKNFKCLQCDNVYRTQKELNRHAKWHSNIKPFSCEQCGKTYKSNHHLTNHMRKHTGERPFLCDICNNSFTTSSALKKHRMIHTGEKPHICQFCGKSFIERSNLKNHMKIHGQTNNASQIQNDIMAKLSY